MVETLVGALERSQRVMLQVEQKPLKSWFTKKTRVLVEEEVKWFASWFSETMRAMGV
jgi:hypothetical protein